MSALKLFQQARQTTEESMNGVYGLIGEGRKEWNEVDRCVYERT